MAEEEHLKTEAEERLIKGIDSEIGKGFSDYITKCVIIIVLLLMFILPLLEVSETDTSPLVFVRQMDDIMNEAVAAQERSLAMASTTGGTAYSLWDQSPDSI